MTLKMLESLFRISWLLIKKIYFDTYINTLFHYEIYLGYICLKNSKNLNSSILRIILNIINNIQIVIQFLKLDLNIL